MPKCIGVETGRPCCQDFTTSPQELDFFIQINPVKPLWTPRLEYFPALLPKCVCNNVGRCKYVNSFIPQMKWQPISTPVDSAPHF